MTQCGHSTAGLGRVQLADRSRDLGLKLKMEGASIVLALTQDRTGHMAQARAYNSALPREQRDVQRLPRLERDQPPGANVISQWFRVRAQPILARAALESVRSHCISPFSQVPVEARHQAQRVVNHV